MVLLTRHFLYCVVIL